MGSPTLSTLQTDLLNRVGDTLGLGLSTIIPPTNADGLVQATSLLNTAQQIINALEAQVINVVNYTNFAPNKLLYGPISQDSVLSTQIIKPTGVRWQNGRDLVFTPFRSLIQADSHWMTATGTRLYTWSLMGRDMLIIYPGLDSVAAVKVQVVGIAVTNIMSAPTDTMNLSDDLAPQVLDMAQLLALVRLRRPEEIQPVMQRLQTRYAKSLATNIWHTRLSTLS